MPFRSEAINFNGNLYLPLAGGTMKGSILVNIAGLYDLGSVTNHWRSVYAHTVAIESVDSRGVGPLDIGKLTATSIAIGSAAITTTQLGTWRYDNSIGTAAGNGLSLMTDPVGYLIINVGGVEKRLPYYDPA